MVIKSLKLKNYRNYSDQKVLFFEGLNVLTGVNASGKTNLLEALYLAGIGKSPRTVTDKDLIMWGEDFLYLEVIVKKKYHTHKIEIHIDNRTNKRIAIDGNPILKIGELMGVLNIVFFSPDEMKMIKESPKERRRFMDISLSQQKKVYFYALQRYNRILEQRNKLLKNTKSLEGLKEMLTVWDIQLSEAGADIILKRVEFINKLNIHAKNRHNSLTGGKEILNLSYESDSWGEDREEIKSSLLKKLTVEREKDYNLKYTSSGPHRDDIKIAVNDIDVRKFGSQGQQRSAALSLKLAEINHFEEETGEKPVMLLDDVLSELDAERQNQLIKSTQDIQTVLTCTEYDIQGTQPKIFEINKGSIV